MKLLFITSIVFELCLVMVAISPASPFINLKSAVQAYDNWHKNPTVENKSVWLSAKASLKHKQLLEGACVYSLLVLNASVYLRCLSESGNKQAFANA